MGFHEYDRIRSKNRKYNFPTPDINFEARQMIKGVAGNEKSRALYFLKMRLENCVDERNRKVLETAIEIVEKEII